MRVVIALFVTLNLLNHHTVQNGPVPLTGMELIRLLTWNENNEQNIWELSGQFEGDIVIRKNLNRNGFKDPNYHWTNNEMPYEIDPSFGPFTTLWIKEAVEMLNTLSCVKIRPRKPSDVDYVYVTGKHAGCWSYIARQGGRQELNLQTSWPGNGCLRIGVIQHEFLHALGFFHQQSASNRDDYVTILWENIQKGRGYNFWKHNKNVVSDYGVPYDYESIMHYSRFAFTKNGKPTILPKKKGVRMGQRMGLSLFDLVKLNRMYNCTTTSIFFDKPQI